MPQVLDRISTSRLEAIEEELRTVLRYGQSGNELLFGMVHYHMGWIDKEFNPLNNQGGGKRIRPLLTLLVAEAAGGKWRQAVPGAASIEILHNFTLVHDDIQDASPTRRGRTTLWRIWGANQAINAGDAMFALAQISMCRLVEAGAAPQIAVTAVNRLNETCVTLTVGQSADMLFEDQDIVSVSDYLSMIDGKTAALLSFAAEVGAMVAQVDDDTIQHYADFGRELGLAFQVRDDILGIWGDESIIGKSAATDIVTRKKSLPVLYGLNKSDELRSLYSQNDSGPDFVNRVVNLLNRLGAREYAEAYEREFAGSAQKHLDDADPNGDAGQAIRQLADILLNRDS